MSPQAVTPKTGTDHVFCVAFLDPKKRGPSLILFRATA
jgi:hypothetical protein